MTNPSPLEDQFRRIVRASVVDSPPAPSANEIISRRAARSVEQHPNAAERRRPFALLLLSAGAVGAIVVAVLAFRPSGDGSGLLVADSPETTTTSAPAELPPSTSVATTLSPTAELDETESTSTTVAGPAANQLSGPEFPVITRPVLADGRPETFWAIQAETYALVEVDTATGVVLGEYGRWGEPFPDCEDGGDCGMFQGLSDVEVGADGRLWLSDCCEPAVGNTFIVDPGDTVNPLSPDQERVLGTDPVVSPDGRLVARTTLQWIEINSTDLDSPVSWPPEAPNIEHGGSYRAAAWLNSTTLVVIASSLEGTGSIVLLDVSDSTNPRLIDHPMMGGLVPFFDAGVRADGSIFALAFLPTGDDSRVVEGWVYDPNTGEKITTTPLPSDLFSIDYDQSNTYLITVGGDGLVRWYGGGDSGEIASGFVAAGW